MERPVPTISPFEDSRDGLAVHALLTIEWTYHGGGTQTCQHCGSWSFGPTHREKCPVDFALKSFGYPTAESREEGRLLMRREMDSYLGTKKDWTPKVHYR